MDFSTKKRRILEISKAVALSGPGVGGSRGNNFRIGAVLVQRNSVVSAGVNRLHTSPVLHKFYTFPYFHAEASAILGAGDRAYGADLYVSRVRRDGSLALAKPCSECQRLIKHYEIRHVFYSIKDGLYDRL